MRYTSESKGKGLPVLCVPGNQLSEVSDCTVSRCLVLQSVAKYRSIFHATVLYTSDMGWLSEQSCIPFY